MTLKRVAVIGECMVELQRKDGHIKQTFGGDTLNTALYLSRLTHQHGVETSYVTGLGNDSFSQEMREAWQQEKINTDLVFQLEDKNPGLYLIETDNTGERTFHYWRNDSAARYWLEHVDSQQLTSQLAGFDMIYLSGISLAILPDAARETLYQVLETCKQQGSKIVFDNNYRPRLWANADTAAKHYQRILSLTDTALLTFDDEIMLYGEHSVEACIERSQQCGVREIIIKRGAEDCLVIADGNQMSVAATRVDNVVDTTAAGDSFSAGYLAKRLTGGDLEASALNAHKLAGTVIQYQGAIIPHNAMPNL
ncbi:sugar kinase [Photobacterium sanctipauli]|uniref:2-dehydro-3-deoxygluconokinase n=1 Tax=Photobacterium sanctipauli TaxID=1342794 RepID=A0A2T3NX33_9GAMM|nr:sugar kinase [Photobacterium sanctipauli]PSW20844.1 sugar kinase [Photobacterium sanctipauli]